MPKTKIRYNSQIKFNASSKFINYLNFARVSSGAKYKFGKYPTQTEFLRGVIYQWIKNYAPHILIDDIEGNVPEIIELKELKKKTHRIDK